MDDRWKLDPACKFDGYNIGSSNYYEEFKKIINENGTIFTDESQQWVAKQVIDEKDFLTEKQARETLLKAFLLYAKTRERYFKWNKVKGNYLIALNETFEAMKKELDIVANKLFTFELDGQKMAKQRGETMEHYLMREVMLQYFNDYRGGVDSFVEEYSQIRDVLEKIAQGKSDKDIWKEASKRADLYVVLKNGQKLWVEVERTTNSKELNDKLTKIQAVTSLCPGLIDKVVFVFPGLISAMLEGLLIEARKVCFPEDMLEVFEVNLRENQILQAISPKLVSTEFGDRLLDMIADGIQNPSGAVGLMARDRIYQKIILPLFDNNPEKQWITEKRDKTRRLVRFWRIRTGKLTATAKELEFKEKAIRKIKKDYPFLIS
ncbi:MAG: hypothetical protein ACBZ72_07870 [Candidatus Bathyarchaeia archaeon]